MPGQTLSQIRRLLADADLAPRQRFGQNFLIDLNLMRKLVDAAELRPGDVALEVGPGTGSLTEILLDRGVRVVAVEVDHGFQDLLRSRLGSNADFTLVAGDVLVRKSEINPRVMEALRKRGPAAGGSRKLVANLPYQIATPLLMELLYTTPALERMTCTIQKEVGERFGATPNTDAYGPVSVITQSLAEAETIATVPPAAFWPRPRVESTMLTIRPRAPDQVEVQDIPAFVAFVRRGFQQRRKMLRRAVREWSWPDADAVFAEAAISPDSRPEDLSPAAWRRLFAVVARTHP